MDWQRRLHREAIPARFGAFDLLYHVGLAPIVPPEYEVSGIVALTFRLHARREGGNVYVTTINAGAALRMGERIGLAPAEAFALVDSHERVHVALQIEGVPENLEEDQARFADAAWLSLRHPKAAAHVLAGDFGVVTRVSTGLWEALVER